MSHLYRFLLFSFLLVILSACNNSSPSPNTSAQTGPTNREVLEKVKQDYVARCSKSGDIPASICSCAFDKTEKLEGRLAILQTQKTPPDSRENKKFNAVSGNAIIECLLEVQNNPS